MFRCANESAMRRWRRKNTAGWWHRRRGGRTVADHVPMCWSINFRRSPLYIHIYSWHHVYSIRTWLKFDFVRNLADRNNCVSLGVCTCMHVPVEHYKHCSCAKCVVKIDFHRGSRGKYPSILHPTKGGRWVTESRPIYLLPPPPPAAARFRDTRWMERSECARQQNTADHDKNCVRLAWVWQRTALVIRRHVTRKMRTSLWEKPYNFIQRQRQQIPPKRRYLSTKVYDVTFQKALMDQSMEASLAGSG